MARKIEELVVEIEGDNRGFKRSLSGAEASANSFGRSIGRGFTFVATAAFAASAAVTGIATAGVGFGLRIASETEQALVAFETLLGSGEAAQEMIAGLRDFAAKTPFQFAGLRDSAQKLLAMGFAADEVLPTLTGIGDAVASMGGGQAEFAQLSRAMGQIRSKGKATGEELMQLAEGGINGYQMLVDATGSTMEQVRDAVSKGSVSAGAFLEAFLLGTADKFGGAMQAQSQTLAGLFSTLKDTIAVELGGAVEPLIEPLKAAIPIVAQLAKSLIQTALPVLVDAMVRLLPLINEVGPAFADIHATLAPLAAALLPVFSELWAALAPVLKEVAAAIVPLLSALAPLVTALLPILIPLLQVLAPLLRFVAAAITLVTPAFEALAKIVAVVAELFGSSIVAHLEGFTTALGMVTNILGEFVSPFLDAGVALVDGLIRGMMSGLTRVRDAARDLGKKAWEGTKDFLGIRSPSRLFAQLGAFSVEGFLKPFDDIGGGVVNALAPIGRTKAPSPTGASGGGNQIFERGAFEGLMQGAVISGEIDFEASVEAAVGRALRSIQ